MTFQFSSALQWWFPNWILWVRVHAFVCAHTPYICAALQNRRWKKAGGILLVWSAYAMLHFQNNKPYQLNRLSRCFWAAYCFCLEVKNGVGTIIRKITIFLLLNKWYEALLSSGCQEKGMYEPDLWGKSVCFISTPAYFCLLGMDGRRGGGGCHSYHLTHELLQTQVDVDMLQMLVKQDVKVF